MIVPIISSGVSKIFSQGGHGVHIHEIEQKSQTFLYKYNIINWKTENCQIGVHAKFAGGTCCHVLLMTPVSMSMSIIDLYSAES